MLKHITTSLVLASLLAFPSAATAEPTGVPKPKSYYATVRIYNAVDEAVSVAVAGSTPLSPALEPFETRDVRYPLANQTSATVTVTASLVADPSVTATASIKLQKDRTTTVTVASASSTSLSIEAQGPARSSSK